MADTKIEQNTDGLEEILEMAKNLPEGNGSSEPYKINPDLNLLVLGDSLFGNATGRAWIENIGCNVANYAVGSASFSQINDRKYKDGTYNSILDQLYRFQNGENQTNGNPRPFDPSEVDAILIDGGANDYLRGARLGATPDLTYIYSTPTWDTSIAMGGLCTLLRRLALDYPKAQKFFMIMHRVYNVTADTITSGTKKLWATKECFLRARNFELYANKDSEGNVTRPATTVTTYENLYVNLKEVTTIAELEAAIADTSVGIYAYEFVEPESTEGQSRTNITKYAHRVKKESLLVNNTAGNALDTSNIKVGYTYDALLEQITKACHIYGWKIIDLYNESPLNACMPTKVTLEAVGGKWQFKDPYTEKMVSTDVAYENKNGNNEELYSGIRNSNNQVWLPNLELTDWHHIHPTAKGYEIGYTPYVKQALCLATKK